MIPPPSLHATIAACLLTLAPAQDPTGHGFDRDGVLGTSMHLQVRGDRATAQRAETAVLDEIERLAKILSAYDEHSELRRLRAGSPQPASVELREVLAACEHWRRASDGAFDAGVAAFAELWRQAAQAQREPSEERLAATRALLGGPLWDIDDARGEVALRAAVPLTLDGLAKGYIIDRAVAAAEAAGGRDVVLDIGGDLAATGDAVIGVADPSAPADNAAPLCRVQLRKAAIATSGGYARGFEIGGRLYSHIFDPRSGRPVTAIVQSTVVAADAMTADALATILSVLSPDEGLALIATVPRAESLCVGADGTQHRSPGWTALVIASEVTDAAAEAHPGWPAGGELAIDFELAGADRNSGRRRRGRRRPYVAVWIEDHAGQPVRALCLWVDRPRWIGELRRWDRQFDWRADAVAAITRATRAPGSYQLTWDGRDDTGAQVAPGEYTVVLEAAREHGTHQLMRREVTIDGSAFEHRLDGGREIAGATVSFRRHAAAK